MITISVHLRVGGHQGIKVRKITFETTDLPNGGFELDTDAGCCEIFLKDAIELGRLAGSENAQFRVVTDS